MNDSLSGNLKQIPNKGTIKEISHSFYMEVFTIGTDYRSKFQKWKDAKRRIRKRIEEKRRKITQEKCRYHPIYKYQLTINIFHPEPFHYIPDVDYKYRAILQQCKTLTSQHDVTTNLMFFRKRTAKTKEFITYNKYFLEFYNVLRLNSKRRWAFRRLFNRWLKSKTRPLNDVDPCTLAVPKQPIQVYDMAKRGYYIFEAKSLQKMFTSNLAYSDWGFPKPQEVKNPFTNLPFFFGQLLEAVKQLRQANQTSWILEAYMKFIFQKQVFQDLFKAPLEYHGIEDFYRNSTSEMASTLIYEFVEEEFDIFGNELNQKNLVYIQWGIQNAPNHMYIQKWRDHYKKFHEYQILKSLGHENQTLFDRLSAKSKELVLDSVGISSLYTTYCGKKLKLI